MSFIVRYSARKYMSEMLSVSIAKWTGLNVHQILQFPAGRQLSHVDLVVQCNVFAHVVLCNDGSTNFTKSGLKVPLLPLLVDAI